MTDIINVKEVVGSSLCVSIEDGDKVFRLIKDNMIKEKRITLDFTEILGLSTVFVSASIGQLLEIFEEDRIRASLKWIGTGCDCYYYLEFYKEYVNNKTKRGEK